MKEHSGRKVSHSHAFSIDKSHIQQRTLIVVIITCLMMVAEIIYGWLSHSMALFADGWHMGTHALALGISVAAYAFARSHAENSRFSFGTWKMEILGAYTSALVLGGVSVYMVFVSVERLLSPVAIDSDQALPVAIIGLLVNGICAFILGGGNHGHSHHKHDHAEAGPDHHHDHPHHEDLNLKAAYIHVVADALTSIFAIGALIIVKFWKVNWVDPVMGLVGAGLIAKWAFSLIRDSALILLDHEHETPLSAEVRSAIESDGKTHISDLHLWRVADGRYACIVAVTAPTGHTVKEYRHRLDKIDELAHVTVEVNHLSG